MLIRELELRELIVLVRLGWGADERRVPQKVAISVAFQLTDAPGGEVSDELADTICYGDVSALIEACVRDREFKLIEFLGAQIFAILKERYATQALMNLHIHKLHPPIENLQGGSVYALKEFT